VIGVGVIGAGRMGHTHARAYARLSHHYDVGVLPQLVAVADLDQRRLDDFASRYGFSKCYPQWRDLLADPDVHAVSVTVPNGLHRQVGVATAEAGKHLWIEKPVGLTANDARDVAEAVARAAVHGAVGFNYRHFPAVARARRLILDGVIGEPMHSRVYLLSDSAVRADSVFTWRFTREQGGAGVLADLACHGVDLIRFLLGDVERLVADMETFVRRRPMPTDVDSPLAGSAGMESGVEVAVENQDYVSALLQTRGGARVTLEASRVALGHKGGIGFSVQGTAGLVAWDFRRPNHLIACSGGDLGHGSVGTVYTGPGDGEYARFHSVAAVPLGYDDSVVIEAADFMRGVAEGRPHGATLQDAVRVAEILEAMIRSRETSAWVTP
jgi:predicted dehydrogenase